MLISWTLAADAPEPRRDAPLRILYGSKTRVQKLCSLGNEPAFLTFGPDIGQGPAKPVGRPLPDWSDQFVRRGDFLRVKMNPMSISVARNVNRDFSRELLRKDAWYVSADYSTKPPRVILAEKPTKYSRWSWVTVPRKDNLAHTSKDYYVKNDNDLGKDAWLAVEDEGRTYSGGVYERIAARKAILSFDKKTLFGVVDVMEEDDGK